MIIIIKNNSSQKFKKDCFVVPLLAMTESRRDNNRFPTSTTPT